MSKSFKFLGLIVLLVGLMAGSAFAGTVYVANGANNTPFTAALEALGTGAARNVQITGVATGANNGENLGIGYILGQNLTSGNLVTVTFTGAAFDGSALAVCAANAGVAGANVNVQIATATPTANSTSWNFQTGFSGATANAEVAAGGNIWLATNGNCNIAGGKNVPLRATTMASAGMATVSFAVNTAGNVPVDPASAAGNLIKVAAEYTAAMNAASNHTVDYLATPGTGVQLLHNGTAASNLYAGSPVVYVTKANYNLNAVNSAVGGANAGLTAGLVITATDSVAWQGISKVYVAGINAAANHNCTDNAGGNIIGSASPNGTLTFTVPAAAFNASGATNYTLCVVANGTTALNTRTISVGADVNITGTSANDPAAGAVGGIDTWGLNAYQAMIPYSHTNSTVPSYCVINNMGATNVSVIYDVLSSEASLQNLNNTLGTVNSRTTALMTISGSSVTMAGSNTTIDLSAQGTNTRHADRITVTGAPANINASCFQTDPITGGKRNVLTLH